MINRNEDIFQKYLLPVDEHQKDIVEGRDDTMSELQGFAKNFLFIPGPTD
ncbi:hypothetical protein [Paraflavitalea speifideaquila]|nr:hypothetical protein [Paraflavitalea speifideiaquila]